MTTTRPRASSSCTRKGLTSMMRASTCRSLVMIPDWLPVKLIASPPSSRMAIDRSAMEMRSPADSSMSSSRRSGFVEMRFASDSSSSVVAPIADTTTATSRPAALVRMMRAATCRMRSTPATLLPPYFWTTIDINHRLHGRHGSDPRDPRATDYTEDMDLIRAIHEPQITRKTRIPSVRSVGPCIRCDPCDPCDPWLKPRLANDLSKARAGAGAEESDAEQASADTKRNPARGRED